jgi:hypothetical protein
MTVSPLRVVAARIFPVILLAAMTPDARALTPQAQEFMSITKQLEPVQCEKRRLRRDLALAEVESRGDDLKALRARFATLNREPKTAKLERRLAELERHIARSSDPEDLQAISHQQREAFYRCD